MGFCFFTENTTLNIHSLGLNVGQLVHCICIGGGGGGGGGAGKIDVRYTYQIPSTEMPTNINANGANGGTGGITSFGSYVSARGGKGGEGGKSYLVGYNTIYAPTSSAGGASYMENCGGGSGCGNGNIFTNNYSNTAGVYPNRSQTNSTCGGGGGGFGEYVYKSFTLNSELIPITIGAPGQGGQKGLGKIYNFTNYAVNHTFAISNTTNGGNGGAGGHGGSSGSHCSGGGGGSGFGAGGGGGGGIAQTVSNTASSAYYNGGGGGGAGGYFIGEQRIYDKAGLSTITVTGGQSGLSLDYSTLYPRAAAGQDGRTYPVLNKAGSGLVVLMW